MINVLIISLGGAIGAVSRYSIGIITSKLFGESDVLTGTLFSNLIGCFIVGFLLAWMGDNTNFSQEIILLLTVGILGSFTTFSTFALETYQLFEKGKIIKMVSYLFFQVVIAFLLTALGYALYQFAGGG